MAASVDQRHRERLVAMGVDPLTPAQGLHALERLIGQSRPEICVFPVDWRVFAKQLPARARTPLLSELLAPADLESGAGPAAPDQPEFQLRLSKALPRERWNLLVKFLQTEVAHVLGLPASRLPEPQDGFFDIGMDSLMTVELKNRLETSLGRTLPVTAMFNYSTIDALARYLYRRILSTEIAGEPAPSADPDESKLAVELEGLSESDVAELIAKEVDAYRQDRRHG
jgi:acyl carrier protein